MSVTNADSAMFLEVRAKEVVSFTIKTPVAFRNWISDRYKSMQGTSGVMWNGVHFRWNAVPSSAHLQFQRQDIEPIPDNPQELTWFYSFDSTSALANDWIPHKWDCTADAFAKIKVALTQAFAAFKNSLPEKTLSFIVG